MNPDSRFIQFPDTQIRSRRNSSLSIHPYATRKVQATIFLPILHVCIITNEIPRQTTDNDPKYLRIQIQDHCTVVYYITPFFAMAALASFTSFSTSNAASGQSFKFTTP